MHVFVICVELFEEVMAKGCGFYSHWWWMIDKELSGTQIPCGVVGYCLGIVIRILKYLLKN